MRFVSLSELLFSELKTKEKLSGIKESQISDEWLFNYEE